MMRILRYFLVLALLVLTAGTALAQSVTTHKVKRGETIYGIARSYGLTEAELRAANPGMERSDYVLKKGSKIIIPTAGQTQTSSADAPMENDDVRQRSIRMGVMLPLHDINGDGRRMVEYYRGLLMACDSLKHEGISVDVYAWNTPDTGDITEILAKAEAAQCDIIFGPLYSKQMNDLSAFTLQHGIMLVIPYSINAPQVAGNPHIFQVYQSPESLNEPTSRRFADWFKDYHPVIVDCDDPNSTKGSFTAALRKELENRRIGYSLTSLKSVNSLFASAFSTQRPNVVVLNSARSSDMEVAFIKLKDLLSANEGLKVSLFGYTEWMALAEAQAANFHKYDVYIPAPFYPGMAPLLAKRMALKYRQNFQRDMSAYMPPLAMTGFDHALFFLRGLHKYGKTFDGASGRFNYTPVQTPLKFEQQGSGAGFLNRAYMFVHYKPNGQIDTISY